MGDGRPHQGHSSWPGGEGVDSRDLDADRALLVPRGQGVFSQEEATDECGGADGLGKV